MLYVPRHAAQKPVECMERPIRNHEGDVYDPFVGSGTTIIAAERQDRTCYAMELEPGYVDAAVKRWEDYTGGKATRVKVTQGDTKKRQEILEATVPGHASRDRQRKARG